MDSGKTALGLILEELKLQNPDASQVIVPEYICSSVPEAVTDAGLSPVFAPVGGNLNLLPDQLIPLLQGPVLAVLAVHMYGLPCDIMQIEEICRAKNIPLIDDAAQVLGLSQSDRSLGTFGAYGILSFAQSKTVVAGLSGAGGVILMNDPTREEAMRSRYTSLPDAPPSRGLWQFACGYVLAAGFPVLRYYLERLFQGFGFQKTARTQSRISKICATIACHQLDSLPERLSSRRSSLNKLARGLSKIEGLTLPQWSEDSYLCRMMIQLPRNADLPSWRNHLSDHGIPTRLPYPVQNGSQPDYPRTHLLEIPIQSHFSDRQINKIIHALTTLSRKD